MNLYSPDFAHNQSIPSRFTCDGTNTGPTLTIEAPPAGTKAFALIVHDPDAVSGDWLHWSVWNIPGDTKTFSVGALPHGCVQGTTDFGKIGYGGPCPPTGTGTHRYMFELYSLRESLQLSEGADRTKLENAIAPCTIEKAILTGIYSRT
jgi:Raf kinase inhibitor-like YbhB/YbcL family protein